MPSPSSVYLSSTELPSKAEVVTVKGATDAAGVGLAALDVGEAVGVAAAEEHAASEKLAASKSALVRMAACPENEGNSSTSNSEMIARGSARRSRRRPGPLCSSNSGAAFPQQRLSADVRPRRSRVRRGIA
jgi:hypothetical protein